MIEANCIDEPLPKGPVLVADRSLIWGDQRLDGGIRFIFNDQCEWYPKGIHDHTMLDDLGAHRDPGNCQRLARAPGPDLKLHQGGACEDACMTVHTTHDTRHGPTVATRCLHAALAAMQEGFLWPNLARLAQYSSVNDGNTTCHVPEKQTACLALIVSIVTSTSSGL